MKKSKIENVDVTKNENCSVNHDVKDQLETSSAMENQDGKENIAEGDDILQNSNDDELEENEDVENKIVSTSSFFGWSILFGIPVIGSIMCIIMSFAPKRKNLKNFARATLIKSSIGICILVGICIAIFSYINPILEKIRQVSDGVVSTYTDLIEYIGEIDKEDFPRYFELVEKYENGEIDVDLGVKDKVKDKVEGIKDKEDGKIPIINVPNGNVSKDTDASVVIGE